MELAQLTPVLSYSGELSQVILNLLVNAAHAVAVRFGDTGRGHIRVTTAQETDAVVIIISDNGNGIAEEHRARIFEPFFTTKPLGQGTGQGAGQGLAISRSFVVEKHDGSLSFQSCVGSGTTSLPTPEARRGALQKSESSRRG